MQPSNFPPWLETTEDVSTFGWAESAGLELPFKSQTTAYLIDDRIGSSEQQELADFLLDVDLESDLRDDNMTYTLRDELAYSQPRYLRAACVEQV
jgi:hypothetical protein